MIMKKLLSLLIATTMVMVVGTPVQAKSSSRFMLTHFTLKGSEDEHDMRFSYNKQGLVTKIVDHEVVKIGDVTKSTNTYRYTYKKNQLVKRVDQIGSSTTTTTFTYQGKKIIASKPGYTQTLTMKNHKVIKAVSSDFNRTYSYNKKGQLIKATANGKAYKNGYKYDKKGYATAFNWDEGQVLGHFTHKITYKNNLPSVVKQKLNGTQLVMRLYYKKMRFSSSAVKSQQYSFLHMDDPAALYLYNFAWYEL